ncbi:MAG: GAF domain-containing protein, partial [Chitinophagaceae bacterium]|nr:GAF domain-containing protein [Chitinophagaceae bacterium]
MRYFRFLCSVFEGFTIITITDVTTSQAIENIKNTIINRPDHDGREYHNEVIQSLRILAENRHIEFHMLPALRVNDRLVFTDDNREHSLMIKTNLEGAMKEEELIAMTEQYLREPKVLFYNDITEENVKQAPPLKSIRDKGVVSYALLPVYHNNKIAGVLEVFSYVKDALDENVLVKVEAATPLIAQLLQKCIDEFDVKLESVIKEKFTSLQPAVQWKFNEVAWHYLRDIDLQTQKPQTENILFRDVYPLYGAVDIRNSTIERNDALKTDLQVQFSILIDTLKTLKEELNIPIADELAYQCKKAIIDINDGSLDEDHIRLTEFLDTEIRPFLLHFRESDSRVKGLIDKYFEAVNEESGLAFANRRALEKSMQRINATVNQFLEIFKVEIQDAYPCYFEKFRTDGVEYDMYIGQSISPAKSFNTLYLRNIRLRQVTAMAAIVKITHALLPRLSKPLETTQLIFI